MAIFHLSVKPLARRAGRSAVAAAAYRAGASLINDQTGISHNFTGRDGVVSTQIFAPANAPSWAHDRAQLWNAAEQKEVRSDARTAREFEVSLPAELSHLARQKLACDLAKELCKKHDVCVDLAIHAPGGRGDQRNHHAHLLMTTRVVTTDGLGKKTREFEDRKTGPALIHWWRERWGQLVNSALERAGRPERVDHRNLTEQGSEALPQHLPAAAVQYERRTNRASQKRETNEEATVAANAHHQKTQWAIATARTELAAELATPEVKRRPSIAEVAASARARAESRRIAAFEKPQKGDSNDYDLTP
jgi:ATP-dependent exoDNAse (exonuclease V) alpha subunit